MERRFGSQTHSCDEFGEVMENNFLTASTRFWSNIQRLRKGKPCTINAVHGGHGVLLTSIWDIVSQWREYFKELLNPVNMPSNVETESWDSQVASPSSGTEVPQVVKNSLMAGHWGWMRFAWSCSRLKFQILFFIKYTWLVVCQCLCALI